MPNNDGMRFSTRDGADSHNNRIWFETLIRFFITIPATVFFPWYSTSRCFLKVLRLWELLPILLDYLYWLQFFFRSAFFLERLAHLTEQYIYIIHIYIYHLAIHRCWSSPAMLGQAELLRTLGESESRSPGVTRGQWRSGWPVASQKATKTEASMWGSEENPKRDTRTAGEELGGEQAGGTGRCLGAAWCLSDGFWEAESWGKENHPPFSAGIDLLFLSFSH